MIIYTYLAEAARDLLGSAPLAQAAFASPRRDQLRLGLGVRFCYPVWLPMAFGDFSVPNPSRCQAVPRSFALPRSREFGHTPAFGGKLPKFFRGVHWAVLPLCRPPAIQLATAFEVPGQKFGHVTFQMLRQRDSAHTLRAEQMYVADPLALRRQRHGHAACYREVRSRSRIHEDLKSYLAC